MCTHEVLQKAKAGTQRWQMLFQEVNCSTEGAQGAGLGLSSAGQTGQCWFPKSSLCKINLEEY